MASQDPNPPPWKDSMSDGCSGVFNLWFKVPCTRHDHRGYLGGDADDKAFADDKLYLEMMDPRYVKSWIGRAVAKAGMAREGCAGVRIFAINYPPGHRLRRADEGALEVFNWLGKANEEEI